MTVHTITISAMDWEYLRHGDKSFLVLKEPKATMKYGDTLEMHCPLHPGRTLVRWVRYVESGVGYAPDWIGVELTAHAPRTSCTDVTEGGDAT